MSLYESPVHKFWISMQYLDARLYSGFQHHHASNPSSIPSNIHSLVYVKYSHKATYHLIKYFPSFMVIVRYTIHQVIYYIFFLSPLTLTPYWTHFQLITLWYHSQEYFFVVYFPIPLHNFSFHVFKPPTPWTSTT